MDDVRRAARAAGWSEVPTRAGADPHAVLRPVDNVAAPPRSLSAIYGLAAQPLHTDGAHLQLPPDVVVVCADTSNLTPTMLWSSKGGELHRLGLSGPIDNGIFLVSNGRDSFLSPARSRRFIRYDPGCMTPCDQRARQVVEAFEKLADEAAQHNWDSSSLVLVVDNRSTLHARAEVQGSQQSRIVHRVAFYLKNAI